MDPRQTPKLSVILVTDSLDTIRRALTHFRAQSVRDQLEIVIVAPAEARITSADPALDGFAVVRIVEVESLESPALTRTCGLEAATAPVVVFGETHAFPEPRYAEALIEAHREPWGAVGPAMANANPHSMVSWAAFLMDYGRWWDRAERAPMDDLPGHNSSYKRSPLLAIAADNAGVLPGGGTLHAKLRARGYELLLEPAARIEHLNVSQTFSFLRQKFSSGSLGGEGRKRRWPRVRRLLYVAGGPLVPLVRLRRIVREVRRSERASELLPGLLPPLLLGLIAHAAGEVRGLAFGAGPEAERYSFEVDLHREHYLRGLDRRREARVRA